MFGFGSKNYKTDPVLKQMDGREIKYVTQRIRNEDGTSNEVILGKRGRIVVIDDEIRVMCGEKDVFRCEVKNADYSMLLSGDGILVAGINSINGEYMNLTVFYTHYRK